MPSPGGIRGCWGEALRVEGLGLGGGSRVQGSVLDFQVLGFGRLKILGFINASLVGRLAWNPALGLKICSGEVTVLYKRYSDRLACAFCLGRRTSTYLGRGRGFPRRHVMWQKKNFYDSLDPELNSKPQTLLQWLTRILRRGP